MSKIEEDKAVMGVEAISRKLQRTIRLCNLTYDDIDTRKISRKKAKEILRILEISFYSMGKSLESLKNCKIEMRKLLERKIRDGK